MIFLVKKKFDLRDKFLSPIFVLIFIKIIQKKAFDLGKKNSEKKFEGYGISVYIKVTSFCQDNHLFTMVMAYRLSFFFVSKK